MAYPPEVVRRFEEWSEGYDVRLTSRLDMRLAHRYEQRNVFVSRIEPDPTGNPDEFIGQFAIDADHPFFFEHPLDHVPGLMLIEAGRQFGTALAHLHYGVEFDNAFVLDDVQVHFERFAELHRPVFAVCAVRDKVLRRDRLVGMTFEGQWVQGDEPIGHMRAAMRIYDRRLFDRMRRPAMETASADRP